MDLWVIGTLASLAAGLATFVGALPAALSRSLNQRWIAGMLGFGGGVMLAATTFSLIVPGTDIAIANGYSKLQAASILALGICFGGIFLASVHNLFPHEHFIKGRDCNRDISRSRIWLFITAISLHNFPEGMAVGVSFGGDNLSDGLATTLGIGLQNMPEGLVVALSLIAEGYATSYSLWIALLSGLVEPIGGTIGAAIVTASTAILPWAMGFAAGAMLFVICDEIIPESHSRGLENEGTLGVMGGFIVMMLMDISLG